MKELSLTILDIAKNSVKAGATLTEITLTETEEILTVSIKDDGCGMTPEILKSVTDPFYTTRTTRRVGLGIPLFKMSAEQTGGSLTITSKVANGEDASHGTLVVATYYKNHLDFTPLGDVISTVVTLVQGNPDIDFLYIHKKGNCEVRLDTREIRAVLSPVPLDTYEVLLWIEENLREQYNEFK